MAQLTPWFWTSSLQNCERINIWAIQFVGIRDGSSTKLIKWGRSWLADRLEGRTGEAGLETHRDRGGPEDPAPELVDLLSTAGPSRQSVPAAFYPHGPYSRVSLSGETRTQFLLCCPQQRSWNTWSGRWGTPQRKPPRADGNNGWFPHRLQHSPFRKRKLSCWMLLFTQWT